MVDDVPHDDREVRGVAGGRRRDVGGSNVRCRLPRRSDTASGKREKQDRECAEPLREYGQCWPERTNVRNGYRAREFDTRAGALELAIPKLRTGLVLSRRNRPGVSGDSLC